MADRERYHTASCMPQSSVDGAGAVILATAGYDRKICFWHAPSGDCLSTLPFNDSQVGICIDRQDCNFFSALMFDRVAS